MTAPSRQAAVLGHPVSHSLSPALHLAAYRELGLDWGYRAIDLQAGELGRFLESLDDSWVGLSLTMPLKEVVIPHLSTVDALAGRLASANTVLRAAGGALHGQNTDVPGLERVLEEAGVGHGVEATVLGAGATSRSALAALARHGAGQVTVCARRSERASALGALGAELGLAVRVQPFEQAADAMACGLVVSAVPAGAADPLVSQVPDVPGVLVDVVYEPWPTPLARAWVARGGQVVGGLELLVHQAVEQVRLMTGCDVPAAVLRGAGSAELANRA